VRYYVMLGGRTFEVDLTGAAPRIDGEEVWAELSRGEDNALLHLLVDGRSHPLVARRAERHVWELHLGGERYEATVVDERTRAIAAMAGQGAAVRGPEPVRAPMPGLVIRVAVATGDAVAAGQSVVIMEAMKMENDLKAESAGVVARVAVRPGEVVEKGAVLVEFQAGDGAD
jgi:biotin carboxyl carrier protein